MVYKNVGVWLNYDYDCSTLYHWCLSALDLNPEYVKARLRRAQCYEHEDRLEEALEGMDGIRLEQDKTTPFSVNPLALVVIQVYPTCILLTPKVEFQLEEDLCDIFWPQNGYFWVFWNCKLCKSSLNWGLFVYKPCEPAV